ncbi:MAG: hypothetical protein AAF734_03430, partial [Bacteroidota bacterium]
LKKPLSLMFKITQFFGILALLLWLSSEPVAAQVVPKVEHVLHVSVDGLRPDVVTAMGQHAYLVSSVFVLKVLGQITPVPIATTPLPFRDTPHS